MSGQQGAGVAPTPVEWGGAKLHEQGVLSTVGRGFKGVRRIFVRGVNAPLTPEAKKILKI